MSLDVYLHLPGAQVSRDPVVYLREDGSNKAITLAEWGSRFPEREPVVYTEDDDKVYHANITHNLGTYADAFGLYMPLWRPEDLGIIQAKQLIVPLAVGLEKLLDHTLQCAHAALLPENGWGTHAGLEHFVTEYLAACLHFPEAEVSTWR